MCGLEVLLLRQVFSVKEVRKDVLMAILAIIVMVWVVSNKPVSTITNIFALLKNWVGGVGKDVLMEILVVGIRV